MFKIFGNKIQQDYHKTISLLQNDINRLFISQNIINIIAQKDTFKEVAVETLNLIEQKMGYSAASISLVDKDDNTIKLEYLSESLISKISQKFVLSKDAFEKIKIDNTTLTQKAVTESRIIIDDKIEYFISPPLKKSTANTIQLISGIKCMVAVPIRTRNEVIGVLNFSMGKNKEEISEYELKTLELFIGQVGLVIDNIQKYHEIEEFNSELKQKVDVATRDLQIQNRDLQSLYVLTSNVSKSLNPEEVMKIAVDSLPTNQEILGYAINVLDKEEHNLVLTAVSTTDLTEPIRKIVGNFEQLKFNVVIPEHQDTPLVRLLHSREPFFSNTLNDITEPKFNRLISDKIQSILKVNTIAVYPIIAWGKVKGTLAAFVKKEANQIDENQKQLFATYALQIGIALENALFFSKSKEDQTNLEQAFNQVQSLRNRERNMIDVMGHELRTPLSIVRNSLAVMQKDAQKETGPELTKLRRYMEIGLESVRREMSLVETLLSATKLEGNRMQLQYTKVSLIDVVEDSVEAHGRNALQKNIQLIFDRPENDLFVYADRTRIQEIMDNFLSNAVKYTAQGSVTIKIYNENDKNWVAVTDTGVGISQENLQLLGKKFFRAREVMDENHVAVQPGGTGLGLYVAFELIKMMNGDKKISSIVNKGSTFAFALPIFTNQEDKSIDQTFMDVAEKF